LLQQASVEEQQAIYLFLSFPFSFISRFLMATENSVGNINVQANHERSIFSRAASRRNKDEKRLVNRQFKV
jgi:hypothetical protein